MNQVVNVKNFQVQTRSEPHLGEKPKIFLGGKTKASHQRYALFAVIPPRLKTKRFFFSSTC